MTEFTILVDNDFVINDLKLLLRSNKNRVAAMHVRCFGQISGDLVRLRERIPSAVQHGDGHYWSSVHQLDLFSQQSLHTLLGELLLRGNVESVRVHGTGVCAGPHSGTMMCS